MPSPSRGNYPFWPNWARVASWFFGFMNLKAKFDLNRGAYTVLLCDSNVKDISQREIR